jgi:hypothetical protein
MPKDCMPSTNACLLEAAKLIPRPKIWFAIGGVIISNPVQTEYTFFLRRLGPSFVAKRISKCCEILLRSKEKNLSSDFSEFCLQEEILEQTVKSLELDFGADWKKFCMSVDIRKCVGYLSRDIIHISRQLLR